MALVLFSNAYDATLRQMTSTSSPIEFSKRGLGIVFAVAVSVAGVWSLRRFVKTNRTIRVSLPSMFLTREEKKVLEAFVAPDACFVPRKPSSWRARLSLSRHYDVDHSRLHSSQTPLLVFINPKSGGQTGHLLLLQLRGLRFHDAQICDVSRRDPYDRLRAWSKVPNLHVLICGGDGTVGWMLDVVDDVFAGIDDANRPAVACAPLGTGNDLSRSLGWGSFTDESAVSLVRRLEKMQRAKFGRLDRWTVLNTKVGERPNRTSVGRTTTTLNCYLGIGVDAQITMNFHALREAYSQLFTSRLVNKYLWYAASGTHEVLNRRFRHFSECVRVFASLDGNENDVKEIELPEGTEGIIVLNVDSYGGGVQVWNAQSNNNRKEGDRPLKESTFSDGVLDVTAVASSFQLGAAQVGLDLPTRLTQARYVRIDVTNSNFPIQVDGEPTSVVAGTSIHLRYSGSVPILLGDM